MECRHLLYKFILVLLLIKCNYSCLAKQSPEFQLFHTYSTQYISDVRNLTTVIELEDFIVTQAAIYVDNVYEVYQKFFYKLLGELPRSERWHEVKRLTIKMDDFLNIENDLFVKLEKYEHFMKLCKERFITVFEYDANETLLDVNEYNNIYVANQVEEVLTHANSIQMSKFVKYTGDGLKLYLVLNRPKVNKVQLMEFKEIIDKFLESPTFIYKWRSLQMLVNRLKEIFI